MNTNSKGNIALSRAIEWFCKHDYAVFIPLGDNGRSIDLIVVPLDKPALRVQCKYSAKLHRNGRSWQVGLLKTVGRISYKSTGYQVESFDLLFITTPSGDYLIDWLKWCSGRTCAPSMITINKFNLSSELIQKL